MGFLGLWIVLRGSMLRALLPVDIVDFSFSVLLASVLQAGLPKYYELETVAVTMLAVSLLVKVPLAYLSGLYLRARIERVGAMLLTVLVFVLASSAIVGIVMIVLAQVLSFISFPRIVLVYDAVATFVLLVLARLMVVGLKTRIQPAPETVSPIGYLSAHWKQWLSEGMIFYGVSFGALAVYMLWSKFAFGTFSPVSGQIKQWWGSLSGRVYGGSARSIVHHTLVRAEPGVVAMAAGAERPWWR